MPVLRHGHADRRRFRPHPDDRPRHLQDRWRAAWRWWQGVLAVHNNGMEPETWKQHTGGGGVQMFFTYPAKLEVRRQRQDRHQCRHPLPGRVCGVTADPSRLRCTYAWDGWPCTVGYRDPGGAGLAARGGREADPGARPVRTLQSPSNGTEKINMGNGQAGQDWSSAVNRGQAGQFDAFGHQTDGREEYMRDMVWRCVVDWHREMPDQAAPWRERAKSAA